MDSNSEFSPLPPCPLPLRLLLGSSALGVLRSQGLKSVVEAIF
ncbi:hypothetical protein [Fischerella sp. PCC 9605]|nr:hypothetical protein [Fischerella sp. PCC 9605]